LGYGLVSIWPTYVGLFVALLLAGAGKIIVDPAMQAYLGDRVAYSRRGLVIALVEFGWSGAFLLGVPLVGWVVARAGYNHFTFYFLFC
jgi:MFS family permease